MICVLLNDSDFDRTLSPLEFALEKMGVLYRTWRTFREGFPQDASYCDGLIISGGFTMKNYFEEKSDLYGASYLRNFNKPILGICLGMQILARLAGVSLVVSKELGLSRVWLDGGNDLFKGMKSPLEVCQRHNYALPYVPHGYSIIARNDSTFIQGIASKDNLKYGIQFHPEEIDLGSELESLKIFSNFFCIVERHSTVNSGGGK